MSGPAYAARTEKPTLLRLQEAARKGQVARSGELTAILSALAAIGLLSLLGPRLLAEMTRIMTNLLGGAGAADLGATAVLLKDSLWRLLAVVGPLTLGAVAVVLVAAAAQVGLRLTVEPLRPQWQRLSPAQGWRRLTSPQSLIRVGMAILKLAVVSVVVYVSLRDSLPRVMMISSGATMEMVARLGHLLTSLCVRVGVVLLAAAAMDYLFQRWQWMRDLKMTRQEVKEELRRMEGDPLARSRRRGVARRGQYRQVRTAVEQARVVLASAAGGAAAIAWRDGLLWPVVAALGGGRMGEFILRQARHCGVPVIENDTLTVRLLRRCRPGGPVPAALRVDVARALVDVAELRSNGAST